MASGFLGGKYKPAQSEVAESRSESGWAWHERFFAANADESLAALLDVDRELGKTPGQAIDMPSLEH